MAETAKGKRGGARPGAGRKKAPGPLPMKKFNFSLPGEFARTLERVAAALDVKPSRWIRDTIRQALLMASMSLPEEDQMELPGMEEEGKEEKE